MTFLDIPGLVCGTQLRIAQKGIFCVGVQAVVFLAAFQWITLDQLVLEVLLPPLYEVPPPPVVSPVETPLPRLQ